MIDLGHVPGDDDEDGGEDGEGNFRCKWSEEEHEEEECCGVDHAGEGGSCAGFDAGGGAGDGAGGGNSAEDNGADVGEALGDEFAVALVAAADHSVSDDGAEE